MPTTHPAAVSVAVSPAVVTVVRAPEREDYEARFTLTPTGDRWTEWLVITPRHPVHPQHQAQHWLGEPLAGWHGPPADLPSTVTCPVNVAGVNPDTEHRATVYVALRLRPDEVTTQRFTVVVTRAQTVVATEPAVPLAALGTPVPRPQPRTAPSPLATVRSAPPSGSTTSQPAASVTTAEPSEPTAGLERFCPKCGRAFGETEKFCPKDGRLRQPKRSA
jgi:hypothetical protein